MADVTIQELVARWRREADALEAKREQYSADGCSWEEVVAEILRQAADEAEVGEPNPKARWRTHLEG